MKNLLDHFIQSKLRPRKRPDSGTMEDQISTDFKQPPPTTYPSFFTSILKDFINGVTKEENPVILDIGPVIGSNLEYFLSLGIKIYLEDLLDAYVKPKDSVFTDDHLTLDEKKFFSENFNYEDNYFHGLICWDVLDYLEASFAKTFVERISAKMKPNSFVLGFFHTQKGDGPTPVYKYRVLSETKLEYVPLELKMETRKIYLTRDINQLFAGYQSQKFCLLKHNILEVLLKKE